MVTLFTLFVLLTFTLASTTVIGPQSHSRCRNAHFSPPVVNGEAPKTIWHASDPILDAFAKASSMVFRSESQITSETVKGLLQSMMPECATDPAGCPTFFGLSLEDVLSAITDLESQPSNLNDITNFLTKYFPSYLEQNFADEVSAMIDGFVSGLSSSSFSDVLPLFVENRDNLTLTHFESLLDVLEFHTSLFTDRQFLECLPYSNLFAASRLVVEDPDTPLLSFLDILFKEVVCHNITLDSAVNILHPSVRSFIDQLPAADPAHLITIFTQTLAQPVIDVFGEVYIGSHTIKEIMQFLLDVSDDDASITGVDRVMVAFDFSLQDSDLGYLSSVAHSLLNLNSILRQAMSFEETVIALFDTSSGESLAMSLLTKFGSFVEDEALAQAVDLVDLMEKIFGGEDTMYTKWIAESESLLKSFDFDVYDEEVDKLVKSLGDSSLFGQELGALLNSTSTTFSSWVSLYRAADLLLMTSVDYPGVSDLFVYLLSIDSSDTPQGFATFAHYIVSYVERSGMIDQSTISTINSALDSLKILASTELRQLISSIRSDCGLIDPHCIARTLNHHHDSLTSLYDSSSVDSTRIVLKVLLDLSSVLDPLYIAEEATHICFVRDKVIDLAHSLSDLWIVGALPWEDLSLLIVDFDCMFHETDNLCVKFAFANTVINSLPLPTNFKSVWNFGYDFVCQFQDNFYDSLDVFYNMGIHIVQDCLSGSNPFTCIFKEVLQGSYFDNQAHILSETTLSGIFNVVADFFHGFKGYSSDFSTYCSNVNYAEDFLSPYLSSNSHIHKLFFLLRYPCDQYDQLMQLADDLYWTYVRLMRCDGKLSCYYDRLIVRGALGDAIRRTAAADLLIVSSYFSRVELFYDQFLANFEVWMTAGDSYADLLTSLRPNITLLATEGTFMGNRLHNAYDKLIELAELIDHVYFDLWPLLGPGIEHCGLTAYPCITMYTVSNELEAVVPVFIDSPFKLLNRIGYFILFITEEIQPLIRPVTTFDDVCFISRGLAETSIEEFLSRDSRIGQLIYPLMDDLNYIRCPIYFIQQGTIEILLPALNECFNQNDYDPYDCLLFHIIFDELYLDILFLIGDETLLYVSPVVKVVANFINISKTELWPVLFDSSSSACDIASAASSVLEKTLSTSQKSMSWYQNVINSLVPTICNHEDDFKSALNELLDVMDSCHSEMGCVIQTIKLDPILQIIIDAQISGISDPIDIIYNSYLRYLIDLLPYYFPSFRFGDKEYPTFDHPQDWLVPVIEAGIPTISDLFNKTSIMAFSIIPVVIDSTKSVCEKADTVSVHLPYLLSDETVVGKSARVLTDLISELFCESGEYNHIMTLIGDYYGRYSDCSSTALSVECMFTVSITESYLLKVLNVLPDIEFIQYPLWFSNILKYANILETNRPVSSNIWSIVSTSNFINCFEGANITCVTHKLFNDHVLYDIGLALYSSPTSGVKSFGSFTLDVYHVVSVTISTQSLCTKLRSNFNFFDFYLFVHIEDMSPFVSYLESFISIHCFITDLVDYAPQILTDLTNLLSTCHSDQFVFAIVSKTPCVVGKTDELKSLWKPIADSLDINLPRVSDILNSSMDIILSDRSFGSKFSNIWDNAMTLLDLNVTDPSNILEFFYSESKFSLKFTPLFLLDHWLLTLTSKPMVSCLKSSSPSLCVLNSVAVTIKNDGFRRNFDLLLSFVDPYGLVNFLLKHECHDKTLDERISQSLYFSRDDDVIVNHNPSLRGAVNLFSCEIVDFFGHEFYYELEKVIDTIDLESFVISHGHDIVIPMISTSLEYLLAGYILNFYSDSSNLTIPSSLLLSLPDLHSFSVWFTSRNGFDTITSDPHTVTIINDHVDFDLSIVQSTDNTAFSPIVLSIDRQIHNCGSFEFISQEVAWNSSLGLTYSRSLTLPSTSALPGPHHFEVSVKLNFKLNGHQSSISKSASHSMFLVPPPLTVSFASGSSALVSPLNDFSLQAITNIPVQYCSFYWSCSGSCPSLSSYPDSPQFKLTADQLSANSVLKITVVVEESFTNTSTNSTFDMSVSSANEPFSVSFKPIPRPVLATERLVLEVEVEGDLKSLQWSSTPNLLTSDNLLSTTDRRILVIKPNVLAHGQSLSFSVEATSQKGSVSSASVQVVTAARPEPGILNISPSQGFALSTMFTIVHFSDLDLVSYQWFIQRGNTLVALSRTTVSNRIEVLLPPGQKSNNYELILVGRLIDSHDVVSDPVTSTVTVVPLSAHTNEVLDRVSNSAKNLRREEDLAPQIGVIADTLNSVDRDDVDKIVREEVRNSLASELEAHTEDSDADLESVSSSTQALQSVVSDGKELNESGKKSSGKALSNLAQNQHSNDDTDDVLMKVANTLVDDSSEELADEILASVNSIAEKTASRRVCGETPFQTSGSSVSITSGKSWREDLEHGISGAKKEKVQVSSDLDDHDCIGYRAVSLSNDHRTNEMAATGSFGVTLTSVDDDVIVAANLTDPITLDLIQSKMIEDNETIVCKYWDTVNKEWSIDGVETELEESKVICRTIHLTTFSGIIEAKPFVEAPEDGSIWWIFVVLLIVVFLIGGLYTYLKKRYTLTRVVSKTVKRGADFGNSMEMVVPKALPQVDV
ncbi:hypothetical protein GEMRC1_013661 [Eukaryota sp. GEM-RC1]